MGLFNMIGDVVGTLLDMKKLSGIQEEVDKALDELIASGKCPEALKNIYLATKENPEGQTQEESMSKLLDFAKAINEHKDLLPEGVQEHVGKYLDLVKDIENKSEDIAHQTHQG